MKRALMFLIAFVMIAPSVVGQKLTADEIVAKHLASIATTEKLSSVKTLLADGEVRVQYITQKNPSVVGRFVLASQGNKVFYGMNFFNAIDYPQEKIIFDGSKTDVAMVRAGSRSTLGNFIQSNTSIVSQGLIGGTFMTSWNLMNAAQRGAKISTAGTRKVNGKEAYVLSFTPKGGSDLDITLFFDQQTFQHVRTEYKRVSSSAMGATINESARNFETRFKITEDFWEHQAFEGVTMPTKYKLHYSVSGQNGTTEIAWDAKINGFAVNQNIDPATFAIGK